MGYGINFYYESQGDSAIEKSSWYEYNTLSGFYLSDAKAQYALPGHIIQNLAEEVWSQDDAQYFGLAKRVVRSALKYQLGDIQLSTVSVSKDLNQFI